MKFLADFFPVLLFFLAYKIYDIYVATAVAIAASVLQVGYNYWRHHSVQNTHLITLGVVVIFGGLTIFLQDRTFIMWKPSIINWLFAVAFLGSQFFGEQTMVERMMSHAIKVPAFVWTRLNILWVLFFIAMGAVNLYVANGFFIAEAALEAASGLNNIDLARCAEQFNGQTLDLCQQAHAQEAFWVNFKLFGLMGLTFIFAIVQALYMTRYIEEPDAKQLAKEPNA
jgi:intracellular septation protein